MSAEREYTRRKCVKCERTAKCAVELDICTTCERREKDKLRVKEYRARQKAAGKPDTSQYSKEKNNERMRERAAAGYKPPKQRAKAAEPPKSELVTPEERVAMADKIAQKETARELNANERRSLTVEEAVHIELARRELARRKLIHFIKRRHPRYKDGWFHHMLAGELERFSDEVINECDPRLMVFAPPRHGKSMIGSEEFPAWHFGRAPHHQYIGISYSAPLAYRFSRRVQDAVNSDDFQLLYPDIKLRDDKTSVEEWELNKGGIYVAAGVGGPISGKGAHVLNIDDVIKNREDADSPQYRQLVQDWYTSTAYTRLMPGGGVCIINTRWNFDDLCGWLLNMMDAAEKIAQDTGEWPDDYDKWRIVDYPAIALQDEEHRAKGEALHPERYSLKSLQRIRRTLGDRDFNALYQQRPVPDEGEYFTKEMLRYFDGTPDIGAMSILAAGDLAISKKEYADYSVFVVAGVNENDDLFILDVHRGKWDSLELVDKIFELQKRYRPVVFGLEEGQIEKAIGPFLEKRIIEEKLFSLNIEKLPPGKRDKELRARPIQGRMRQGKVYIQRNAPWVETFTTELLRFPNTNRDDQVDALAWIGQMMNFVHYQAPPRATHKTWRERLDLYTGQQGLSARNPAMAA